MVFKNARFLSDKIRTLAHKWPTSIFFKQKSTKKNCKMNICFSQLIIFLCLMKLSYGKHSWNRLFISCLQPTIKNCGTLFFVFYDELWWNEFNFEFGKEVCCCMCGLCRNQHTTTKQSYLSPNSSSSFSPPSPYPPSPPHWRFQP